MQRIPGVQVTNRGGEVADGTPYVLGRDAMFQPHVQGERERPASRWGSGTI
jgi:hypothetical protein